MNLRTLTNEEFLRYAHTELDELTCSDVGRELLRRLEASAETTREAKEFLAISEEYDVTAAEFRAITEAHTGAAKEQAELLALLDEHNISSPDHLRFALKTLKEIRELADDAGDVFTRLTDLF